MYFSYHWKLATSEYLKLHSHHTLTYSVFSPQKIVNFTASGHRARGIESAAGAQLEDSTAHKLMPVEVTNKGIHWTQRKKMYCWDFGRQQPERDDPSGRIQDTYDEHIVSLKVTEKDPPRRGREPSVVSKKEKNRSTRNQTLFATSPYTCCLLYTSPSPRD